MTICVVQSWNSKFTWSDWSVDPWSAKYRCPKTIVKFAMGQSAAKQQVDQFREAVPELKDLIPELKDVTLKGVLPLNDELGRGAYGSVFTVKHGDVVCAAKKIHPILIESVTDEEKQRIKDDFICECLCCSSIRHPTLFSSWAFIIVPSSPVFQLW